MKLKIFSIVFALIPCAVWAAGPANSGRAGVRSAPMSAVRAAPKVGDNASKKIVTAKVGAGCEEQAVPDDRLRTHRHDDSSDPGVHRPESAVYPGFGRGQHLRRTGVLAKRRGTGRNVALHL